MRRVLVLMMLVWALGLNLAYAQFEGGQDAKAGEGWLDAPVTDDGPLGSMTLIPEGEFMMGDNDGPRNERPEHKVWLDAYYIDRYEVTMSEYQKLLDEDYSIEPPPLWNDGVAVGKNGNRPAVGITSALSMPINYPLQA